MSKNNPTTDNPTPEEEPKKSFVQKTVDRFRTPAGKAVLIGAGSVAALVATYVTGFRKGSDSVWDVEMTVLVDEDTLELEELEKPEDQEETEDTEESTTE